MTQTTPAWLKAMQNGALGEARAKAFLMDRFWILERSVDIEGADLIIQQRLTNRNLLDPTPPKLGFVQVKFFESDKTVQYIHEDYIKNQHGELREDFFVLFHTGYEENAKMYFLTTEMVNSNFEIIEERGVKKYRIYGTKILNTEKYTVKVNSNTLTRIEERLKFADFKKNREFIAWKLPSINTDTSAILPYYKENLDNHWGNIPEEFQQIKKHAVKNMHEIEEIYLNLKAIADQSDPIEAFVKIEELKSDIGYDFGHWAIRLFDKLYDEDFYYTCRNHKEKIENLTEDGILDNYLGIKAYIIESLVTYLSAYLPVDFNTVHSMEIVFSLQDFKIEDIRHQLANASEYFKVSFEKLESGNLKIDSKYYHGIKNISENKFEYYWFPGRMQIDNKHKGNLAEFYRNHIQRPYRECQEKMYEIKYNEIED